MPVPNCGETEDFKKREGHTPMAPIAPPSRAPYDPALYASVGSMADLYDEPMYAAAPHPPVLLFRGAAFRSGFP